MTVRFGLVGYGKGGRFFHAPLVARAEGCALTAAVTRSPRRRAELAADHTGAVAFDDLASMAASGLVDAVTVTTTADTHADLVLEAVDLGLPVVCDKPFALDASAAQRCVDAARAAGVLLSTYQNRRYDNDFRTTRAVVASGALGQVRRIESRLEQFAPPGGVPDSGGGILLDLGAHVVDQVLQLAGPVASVYADVSPERFALQVRHASGVVSEVVGDLALHGRPGPRFRVFGTDAILEVPADDRQADVLMAGGTPADPGWGEVPQASWPILHRGASSTRIPAERADWRDFYTAFAAAVTDGLPVPVDPADSVAGLVVLEAAARSATTGEVVRL
ncbi:Gfo/Idh/MocA family protein [Kineococcus sp. LSe6-4]|uniref:Gfo/Idh/MocA family protein n=1 Tax=Kineococcus halophytocola TaxID=3234027 RepID=A0ABV4GYT9_9ACTN